MSESKKGICRQLIMVIIGNFGILSGGISFGFPSVVLNQLTNRNETVYLDDSQASWYGMFY